VSDLNSRGGFDINTAMPCLQVYTSAYLYSVYYTGNNTDFRYNVLQTGAYLYNSIHDMLNRGKEGADKKSLVMARVSNMPCPVHLDMKPSKLHIHPSNGVFIAVDEEMVYCSCSECKFEEDRQVKGGNLNLVKGTEGHKYGWAMITKDLYSTLISSACVTGEQCPIPAACSCVFTVLVITSVIHEVSRCATCAKRTEKTKSLEIQKERSFRKG
jgi:hypothetical protein